MLELFMSKSLFYIKNGGKQILIEQGKLAKIDYLHGNKKGDFVELDGVKIHNGIVEDIKIPAKVEKQIKDKITIFKKKRRKTYQRKIGCCVRMTLVGIIENGK